MKNCNRFGFMVSLHPLEYYFDYSIEKGFSHLELDLKKQHSFLPTFTPQRIKEIGNFSAANDISLSLHPPFNMNLCSILPMVRRNHTNYLKKCLILARQLGANHLTLHLGNFYRFAPWANPRQSALERLLTVLEKLLPTCREQNIYLALENMVLIPPEAGYAFLGDNIADFEYIFSRIDKKYITLCMDTGHANTNQGSLAYIERLANHIISIHYHDNNGQQDDHLEVGQGTVPWRQLLTALDKSDFKGPYISECFNSPPHESIALLKSYY